MTAFQIVYATVTDPRRLQDYARAAEPLFAAHGGRLVARGDATVLEGEWPWHGAVVFAWPDRATAERVWQSAEYAAIHRLRDGAATFQVILVEGTAPPDPPDATSPALRSNASKG